MLTVIIFSLMALAFQLFMILTLSVIAGPLGFLLGLLFAGWQWHGILR